MIDDELVAERFRHFSEIDLNLTDEEISKKVVQLFRGSLYTEMNCQRHLYVFNKTNIIPEYCFKCYKIGINPRNVIELFKLAMVFDSPNFPVENQRKCMVEVRPSCSGNYKGFIYCKTLSEANAICKLVKKLVEEEISPHVPIEIKRGCSEYAEAYPRYARMHPAGSTMQYNKKWKKQEDMIDATLTYTPRQADENGAVQYPSKDGLAVYSGADVLCMQHWLRYAAAIGDMSYLTITKNPIRPLSSLSQRPAFVNLISATQISD